MKKVCLILLCAMLAFALASCQSAPDILLPDSAPTAPVQEPEGQFNGRPAWPLA